MQQQQEGETTYFGNPERHRICEASQFVSVRDLQDSAYENSDLLGNFVDNHDELLAPRNMGMAQNTGTKMEPW